jgi:uncharacterized membrane protein YhaH (DUF805 family)
MKITLMRSWLSTNFDWTGYTSRDEYRRWLPLFFGIELAGILAVWRWGIGGTIHFPPTLSGLLYFVAGLPIWISFVLLSMRRFHSAGLSRKWLLPLILVSNFHWGDYHLNVNLLWSLAVMAVAATRPDIPEELRTY